MLCSAPFQGPAQGLEGLRRLEGLDFPLAALAAERPDALLHRGTLQSPSMSHPEAYLLACLMCLFARRHKMITAFQWRGACNV